ncbi:MAG: OmpA family protein [Porticoccaceae bacterium]|jgi:chemotaxis protein MotB|nr:flagellar motor protein MotB [Porticoccaceae bacterium]|tara:strand:+ start:1544 stop:2515 length:972 start_codon:yes stop_codon:yes gene_type:complete
MSEESTLKEECPPCPTGAAMWMTTFSDMATLLMALFAMLIAFTEMQKKESMMAMEGDGRLNRGVQNEIESNDMPSGRELNSATGNSDTNEGYDVVVEALSKEIEDGTVKVAIENERIVVRVDSPDSPSLDTSKVQQEQLEIYLKIAQAQDTINVDVKVEQESDGVIADSEVWEAMFSSQYREIREKLTGAIENNSAEVVREGDKIIIRLASEGSFKSGAAELRQGFEGLLTEVGAAIQDVDGLITIEGHTDNLPIGFSMRFKSNWDLSAARSGAVADYLIGQYSFGTGLMVSGLADTRPLTTNNTPEGRARNRRIEVVIDGAY